MKSLRFLLPAFVVAGILPALPAAEAAKEVTVLDFTYMVRNADSTYEKSYEYSFGDWSGSKKVAQLPHKGFIVNHEGSKGGVGGNQGLDFGQHTKAHVYFVVGNGNRAAAFNLTLEDSDGTNQVWDIPLVNVPKGSLLAVAVDLAHPTRQDNPGKKAGLNFGKLASWQIKGDYQDAPLEVMLIKITAFSP
ncbi:MAG: hypothetical protein WDM96_05850 [Lacunisphaera sp.]